MNTQNECINGDEIIKIPSHIKYLSEYIDELPKNCLFDKSSVGCGGTFKAINSNEDYVICVPFVSLLENKLTQHSKDGLFGVKAGVTVDDIKKYLSNTKLVKIIVTYDSLLKVIEALGDKCKDVNILVDELHLLFTQYTFRRDAANIVLNNYLKFKAYTFMTATMIKPEYMLKQLRGIRIVRCEWESAIDTTIKSIKCNDPKSTVINMISQHLRDEKEENLYFFINSIKFVNNVCSYLGLNNSNARLICSKLNKDKKVLKISDVDSAPKKINFVTSTAFEGCDIMDENGVTIIVSDGSMTHTLVDISTSLVQICGRIRNSKHNDNVCHLFSFTRYNSLTPEEHSKSSREEIDKANHVSTQFKMLDKLSYDAIGTVNALYLTKNEEELWEFDENAVLIDMYNYEICNGAYRIRSRMNKDYTNSGLKVKEGNIVVEKIKTINKAIDDTLGFKFDEYVKAIKKEIDVVNNSKVPYYNLYLNSLKEEAYIKYPFLPEAIEKLGFDKMKMLRYTQAAIKKELVGYSKCSEGEKMIKLCKLLNINAGEFYTLKNIKEKLTLAYKSLSINKTAKATDIGEWFDVKRSTPKINGVKTEGYTIIRSRIIFK